MWLMMYIAKVHNLKNTPTIYVDIRSFKHYSTQASCSIHSQKDRGD